MDCQILKTKTICFESHIYVQRFEPILANGQYSYYNRKNAHQDSSKYYITRSLDQIENVEPNKDNG